MVKGVENLHRRQAPGRTADQSLYVGRGHDLADALEPLLEIEPLLVPADDAGQELVAVPQLERPLVPDTDRTEHRQPAAPEGQAQQTEAIEEVDPPQVHQAEVAGIVHVEVEVEIGG